MVGDTAELDSCLQKNDLAYTLGGHDLRMCLTLEDFLTTQQG